MKRIVILGGGFAGIYTASTLQKLFKKHRDQYEIVLVNRDNYFTYQPMLAEVVAGSIEILDSVSSLRSLLKHTTIYVREISNIDLKERTITLSPNFYHTDLNISYDHLVIALGNVTDFRKSPGGLHEHAFAFKTLKDAIKLRNHLIDVLESAAIEPDPQIRKQLLTFVIGGGGFSGVEIVAEINDLVRLYAKKYPSIIPNEIRVVLVHKKDRLVDKELSPSLGRYAEKLLKKRGIEIFFNTELTSATPQEAILSNQMRIASSTIVSTVPSTPNPLIEKLPLDQIKGKIKTDSFLRVSDSVWALGDCAAVPIFNSSELSPPTAQFAVRQGKCLAHNIFASCFGKELKPFSFKALGMMASLGYRTAIAELFGKIKLSGFIAWLFWRVIYWLKIPGTSRKVRIVFSWLLDMIIPQEFVQLKAEIHNGITHLHYAKGETIFRKGDIGDYLYIIVSGKVEILAVSNEKELQVATLGKGEYFGEMALLNQKKRNATVRCLEDTELLAIRKNDFQVLVTNFGNLREEFYKTEKERLEKKMPILNTGDILDFPKEDPPPHVRRG
ncbi:MAG: cyclic nucleotide-binding domain-containing protein [Chlamydiae bacterium]|nr:cyclic nucleotide-binding domain-containing protein [Chlamydiota bacterium]